VPINTNIKIAATIRDDHGADDASKFIERHTRLQDITTMIVVQQAKPMGQIRECVNYLLLLLRVLCDKWHPFVNIPKATTHKIIRQRCERLANHITGFGWFERCKHKIRIVPDHLWSLGVCAAHVLPFLRQIHDSIWK